MKINKLNETEVEIETELDWESFAKYKDAAVKHMADHVDLPGFRKGHVPENILRERLGPMAILEEMAERAIRGSYPAIILDNKINAVGRPEVTITKIAEGSPLAYKIKQAILPEIKLPDYKKIAKATLENIKKDEKSIEVTEDELKNVLEEINKAREKEGEKAELTSEERENVRKNLAHEKELRAKDKRRIAVVNAILAETKLPLPKVLVERQMDRFMDEVRDNLERMGAKWEEYVKRSGKTETDIRESSREDAEKRVRTQLILDELARAEKVEPDQAELDREVSHIMEHYKNADEEAARDYVAGIIRNTKVFEMLEALS